jgi:two-component system, LytTR family, response regulator
MPKAMTADQTFRAVVVDDEPAGREAVLALLQHEPAVRVVAQAANGLEAVQVIRREQPDLLFLDIQMPDRDGFQVLEALGDEVPRGLVFVTAHDQHALRAFEVHALDYVLKPFGQPRFHAAVTRALERLRAQDALAVRGTVAAITAGHHPERAELATDSKADTVTQALARPRRIGVRTGSKVVLLDIDMIDWVEARGDYVRVQVGTRAHLLSKRMHEMEQILDQQRFLRIHRSIIVNLDRVAELERDQDGAGALVLYSGVRLRVARGRWDELVAALGVRGV